MSSFLKFLGRHLEFLFCLMVLGACVHTSVEQDYYFDEEGSGDLLTSTTLLMDSTRAGMRCDCVIGDKLIFTCLGASHRYEIFSIKGDSLLYERNFMNIGRGPNEMLSPKFQYDSKRNRMYLYSRDNEEDKFFIVDLKDFNNVFKPLSWEKKRLPIIYTRGELGILNDSVFLNTNNTKTANMFSLSYASNKDHEFKCLNFQYPGEHQDLSLLHFLFTGALKQCPASATFVYSCYFSQYVFIFDIVNEQIENIRYISQVLPIYKVTNDLYNPFTIANEYKQGFDALQVTSKYIYIGYNNVTWGDILNRTPYKGYSNAYFDRINVFDWQGNFVKRLVLDKPVFRFVIDPDNHYLYASSIDITQEDQPDQVLRFKLSGEM